MVIFANYHQHPDQMLKRWYKKVVPERIRLSVRMHLAKAISLFYVGGRYRCNCCNRSFRSFLAKGNIRRENAQCPYCGSLERSRLLLFYLKQETGLFDGNHRNILHFAPERSLYQILRRMGGTYIDGDINPAYATHRIDITNIPYPDNFFDLIICSHVLGHVADEKKAIGEMHRVLKEDGFALIMTLLNPDAAETMEDTTLTSSSDRLNRYGEPDLCRLHGMDFAKRLELGGFRVETIDYRKALSGEVNERYRLGDGRRELIFRCTR